MSICFDICLNFYVLMKLFYCRSLICQLEEVDPRKLKHEEKLAFWIKIHNALVMHVMVPFILIILFILLISCADSVSFASGS